jgi:hypothetical protein
MSNDIEYEEETFLEMMKLAREVHIHDTFTVPIFAISVPHQEISISSSLTPMTKT